MYGLVNKAIEGMISEQFGDETWEQVAEAAGVDEGTFISLDSYDDEVTYKLVSAASEILETSQHDLLVAFGTYWSKYLGQEGYGSIMALDGKKLGEFLSELNDMHFRVSMMMPDLKPPSFSLVEPSPGTYDLHYESTRMGLGPMVLGLLQGIVGLMHVDASVDWSIKKAEGASHDVFRISAAA